MKVQRGWNHKKYEQSIPKYSIIEQLDYFLLVKSISTTTKSNKHIVCGNNVKDVFNLF